MASVPIVHLELHTGDLPAARALYSTACGWPFDPPTPDTERYLPLNLGGGLTGGIVAARARHSLWLPYARVPSVSEATALAAALGAEVLLCPQDGPTGRRSVVSTGPGAQIAFWQPAPGASSPRSGS